MSATIPSKTLGVLRRKKIKNRLKICTQPLRGVEPRTSSLLSLLVLQHSEYLLTTMESLFFRIVLPNPITSIIMA
jgi:hypothetical protein